MYNVLERIYIYIFFSTSDMEEMRPSLEPTKQEG